MGLSKLTDKPNLVGVFTDKFLYDAANDKLPKSLYSWVMANVLTFSCACMDLSSVFRGQGELIAH